MNHYWVDFFIFLFIFIPVAKVTLGKKFGGREGNVISVIIGLVLALSLSLMERRMGFSIKSFGPIAAVIFIFLVALIIFYLVKTVGTGNVAAGSIALVVTYFLMRATVPNFFLWLENNRWTAWLHLALVVAVAISIWKIFKTIWPKSELGAIGHSLDHSHNPASNNPSNIDSEKKEAALIKTRLEGITKRSIKESKEIIDELNEMIKIIDEYGDTDHGRHLIAEKINHIAPKENQIIKQLAYLKELSRKIESFDLRSFKELKAKVNKFSEKERDMVKKEIQLEKRKILSEEKLKELESALTKYDKDFRYCLKMSTASLSADQSGQARDWLLKAIKHEEEAMKAFKEMKKLEEGLFKLTKIEYKAFKTQEKEGKD
jgi:hypothetical protein